MNKDLPVLKIRKNENSYIEETIKDGEKIQILYQKIGSKWFTYSLIEDELFLSSVDEKELELNTQKHGNA